MKILIRYRLFTINLSNLIGYRFTITNSNNYIVIEDKISIMCKIYTTN